MVMKTSFLWTPYSVLLKKQTGAPTVEINMDVPQKLERDLPYGPAILRHVHKRLHSLLKQNLFIHAHHCSVHKNQKMRAVEMSISWAMDTENVVINPVDFYSSVGRKQNDKLCWQRRDGIEKQSPSEWSNPDSENQAPHVSSCMWLLASNP